MYCLLFVACFSENKPNIDTDNDVIVIMDADGDGYTDEEDCDDDNSNIHPGMEEICDGVDNNCNDEIDESVQIEFYKDADEDGFGDFEGKY